MKIGFTITMAGVLALTAGCATSSKVQQMIDASHRESLDKSAAHEASIDVLKQSSVAALEQGKANAEALVALQQQLKDLSASMQTVKGYAEAAKLMSAANTVKVAGLEEVVNANREELDESLAKLQAIDKLYEEVMIAHYKMLADSANAAIESLRTQGGSAMDGEPIAIGETIEIVAPDTSLVPTNPPGN
jgi:chromosome segregation ATPase